MSETLPKSNQTAQSVHTIVADTPQGQAEYAVLQNKGGFQLRRLTPKPLSKKQRRRINKQFEANK